MKREGRTDGHFPMCPLFRRSQPASETAKGGDLDEEIRALPQRLVSAVWSGGYGVGLRHGTETRDAEVERLKAELAEAHRIAQQWMHDHDAVKAKARRLREALEYIAQRERETGGYVYEVASTALAPPATEAK